MDTKFSPQISYFIQSGSLRDIDKAPSPSRAVSTFGNLAARTSDAAKDGLTSDNQAQPKNVNKESIVDTVRITRLAGESLGLGLKFEGGSRASERVKRLLVQGWYLHSSVLSFASFKIYNSKSFAMRFHDTLIMVYKG